MRESMSDSMKVPLTGNRHPPQAAYYSAKVSSFDTLASSNLQNHGTAMIQCLSTQTEHAGSDDIQLVPRTYVSGVARDEKSGKQTNAAPPKWPYHLPQELPN